MMGRTARAISLKIPTNPNRLFSPGSTGVRYTTAAAAAAHPSPGVGGISSTAMRMERRKSHRRAVSIPARIEITIGSPPRDCLVTDLSDGGVRLFIEATEVPDRFVLWFSADGRSARPRDCTVVWRLGYEIGARFADARGRGHKASSTAKVDVPAAV